MKILKPLLLIISLFFVYNSFFKNVPLVANDWPYIYSETAQSFSFQPILYRSYVSLGNYVPVVSGVESYYQTTNKLFVPLIGWNSTERLFWLIPFLILSVGSMYYLSKSYLACFLYTVNTYILMIIGGGQLGVALGYAVLPLVIKLLFDTTIFFERPLLTRKIISQVIVLSLVFGLTLFLDIRIFYLVVFITGMWILFCFFRSLQFKKTVWLILTLLIIPSFFALLLNFFWILPVVIYGAGYSELRNVSVQKAALEFLSFAKFENSLSFVHPNWPENIFGKVGFLKPEFLLFPLMVFSALLFRYKQKETHAQVIFFVILGLIGAFLAKGVNPPFGIVYELFYYHLPFFYMFRDPSKFYIFVSLSYSVLFAITCSLLTNNYQLKTKKSIRIRTFCVIGFIALFLGYILKPAFSHELSGIFQNRIVPSSYVDAKDFIIQHPQTRFLWFPTKSIYSYYSTTNPGISANDFFNTGNSTKMLKIIAGPSGRKLIQENAIGYIVIPKDTEHTIYVKNRTYNPSEYHHIIEKLDSVSWLTKIQANSGIVFYQVQHTRSLFSTNSGKPIPYRMSNSTRYTVSLSSKNKSHQIIFANSFDPHWQAEIGTLKISPSNDNGHIRFQLPKNQHGEMTINFLPQKTANSAQFVSLSVLILLIGSEIFILRRPLKKRSKSEKI